MGRKKQSLKITPEIVSQRKIELIKRDPLTHEWNNLIKEEKNLKKESPQKTELSNKLERIGRKLISKWQVSLMQNPNNPFSQPLAYLDISAGSYPTVFDATDYIKERLRPIIECTLKTGKYYNVYVRQTCSQGVKESRPPEKLLKETDSIIFSPSEGGFGFRELSNGEYRDIFYIPIQNEDIPIIIDPGGLTENNLTMVLNQVKDILKKRIKERKSRIGKRWNPLPQGGEPTELGFIYSIAEDTFKDYLKWYDIRIKEKLSFRLIALIDNENNPQRALELLKKFSHKKVKWGISVKGEDKIEKGVKLIYKAIHRIDYSTKEQEAEFTEYSCPTHRDNNCTHSCKYPKEWFGRFNRLMPEIKL